MSLLEMKNIKKSFNGVEVLKDISLTAEKGEILKVIRELVMEHMTMVIVTLEMNFAKNVSDILSLWIMDI